jgi:hypothetical protein
MNDYNQMIEFQLFIVNPRMATTETTAPMRVSKRRKPQKVYGFVYEDNIACLPGGEYDGEETTSYGKALRMLRQKVKEYNCNARKHNKTRDDMLFATDNPAFYASPDQDRVMTIREVYQFK